MGIHSGKFGVVNGHSTIRNWTVTEARNNVRYRASNTRGGSARVPGIHTWSGSFGGYGGLPLVMPGEIFTFAGYTAPANNVLGANGQRITGQAIVDNIAITWDWAGGNPLSYQVNFSGHLDPAWTSAAALSDSTIPEIEPICDKLFEFSVDDGSTFAELEDLTTATLTLTAENQAYVNSSTNCYTGRVAGPFDWTLAVTQQSDVRAGGDFDIGDNLVLRAYTSATEYWLLKWGMVKDFTGLNVDRESGAILQRTINLEMNGFVGGVVGEVEKPGAVAFWPF